MDPHGKSTASKLKFVFQYIIFPTWIFSLEEFWSLKPYKGIPMLPTAEGLEKKISHHNFLKKDAFVPSFIFC